MMLKPACAGLPVSAARSSAARPVAPCRALPIKQPLLKQQQPELRAEEEPALRRSSGLLVAGLAAVALLGSAAAPFDVEAARSGGRAGGSGGFRAARSAPRTAPRTAATSNRTVVAAPPVYAGGMGYGMPFGGFGYGFMPSFVMPFPFFGGLLQFFFLATIVSLVFNVVRAVASNKDNSGGGPPTSGGGSSSSSGGGSGKSDGWGDL